MHWICVPDGVPGASIYLFYVSRYSSGHLKSQVVDDNGVLVTVDGNGVLVRNRSDHFTSQTVATAEPRRFG